MKDIWKVWLHLKSVYFSSLPQLLSVKLLDIYLYINLFIYLYINLSIYLYINLFIYLWRYHPTCEVCTHLITVRFWSRYIVKITRSGFSRWTISQSLFLNVGFLFNYSHTIRLQSVFPFTIRLQTLLPSTIRLQPVYPSKIRLQSVFPSTIVLQSVFPSTIVLQPV